MKVCELAVNRKNKEVRTRKAKDLRAIPEKKDRICTEMAENELLLCQMCQKQRKILSVFAVALLAEGED